MLAEAAAGAVFSVFRCPFKGSRGVGAAQAASRKEIIVVQMKPIFIGFCLV